GRVAIFFSTVFTRVLKRPGDSLCGPPYPGVSKATWMRAKATCLGERRYQAAPAASVPSSKLRMTALIHRCRSADSRDQTSVAAGSAGGATGVMPGIGRKGGSPTRPAMGASARGGKGGRWLEESGLPASCGITVGSPYPVGVRELRVVPREPQRVSECYRV